MQLESSPHLSYGFGFTVSSVCCRILLFLSMAPWTLCPAAVVEVTRSNPKKEKKGRQRGEQCFKNQSSEVQSSPSRQTFVGSQRSALPGHLGNGMTSLMLSRPVAKRTILSKPMPNPLCLTEPNRRRSKYHSYGSTDKPWSTILHKEKMNIQVTAITSLPH